MGWMFQYGKPADIKTEIARLCTWDTGQEQGQPLKIMNYGSTWYVAVKVTGRDKVFDFEQAEDGSYVFAAVFLTQVYKGDWGYKDMDETMGPNQSNCPKGILDLLSPTTSQYALEWRERCRRPKIRVKTGDKLRIKEAWEPYGTDFEKIQYGRRRGVYKSLKTGALVRLAKWQVVDAQYL